MSLLGPVYVILSLSRRQEDALVTSATALDCIAGSLTAIVERLDAASGLTPEQEQQVAALIAQLKQSGDALKAAEAAQP